MRYTLVNLQNLFSNFTIYLCCKIAAFKVDRISLLIMPLKTSETTAQLVYNYHYIVDQFNRSENRSDSFTILKLLILKKKKKKNNLAFL